MDSALPASPTPELGYRIAGAAREVFTRSQLRDQIRQGALTADMEISPENSDNYRPASTYQELARYFAMAAAPRERAAGAAARPASSSVLARALPGMIYPWTGIGWIVIFLATVLQTVPLGGGIVAGVFTAVYGLAVIRNSSEGSTTMPRLGDLGGPVEFILMFLKLVVVTLVSAWPILLAIPLMFVLRSGVVIMVAGLVMILYYPAAVATLARWKTIRVAIQRGQIFSFIRILGADYLVALLGGLLAIGLAAAAGVAAFFLMGKGPSALIAGLLATWASFYFHHLLGWGMHHHADEI